MQARDKVTNFINRFEGKPLSKELVIEFWSILEQEFDLSFHPDDDFNNYVNKENQSIFTPYEANILNEYTDKLFQFCDQNGLDIYDLAMTDNMRNMIGQKSNIQQTSNRSENELNLMGESYGDEIATVSKKIAVDPKQGLNKIMPYFNIAKRAKELNKIKGIMEGDILQPEHYDGDVYFTILNLDETYDIIQYENTSDTIIIIQDIESVDPVGDNSDDISIEGFKKYLLGESIQESYGDEIAVDPINLDNTEDLLETTFLSELKKVFVDLKDTNLIFSQTNLYDPGDYVIKKDNNEIFIKIKLSNNSFSDFNEDYKEIEQWFNNFCNNNGLPSSNQILSDDKNSTITFLIEFN